MKENTAKNKKFKNRRALASVIFVFLLVPAVVAAVIFFDFKHLWSGHIQATPEIIEKANELKALHQALEDYQKIFEAGDDKNLSAANRLNCPEIFKVINYNPEYSRCQPDFMQCLYQDEKYKKTLSINKKIGKKTYQIELVPVSQKSFYQVITRANTVGEDVPFLAYKFRAQIQGSTNGLYFTLENTCRDVNLPQRTYVYKEHSRNRSKEIIWNNFSRNIFIDRHLVTFKDIERWVKYAGGDSTIRLPEDKRYISLPADNLTSEQMIQYCQSIGGQVLQSHILDAASFYPLELIRPKYVDRSFPPFPWAQKKYNQKLFRIQNGQEEFDIKDCQKFYTNECMLQRRTYSHYSTYGISWMGINNLIGGYPEYVVNPFNPQLNIRASSFYLLADNKLNQLGKRISWNGQEHFANAFTYMGNPIFGEMNIIKVGFRCMKYKD